MRFARPTIPCEAQGCKQTAAVVASAYAPALCSRHLIIHLVAQRGTVVLVCRVYGCNDTGRGPEQLCSRHRNEARRLNIPLDSPPEMFVPPNVSMARANRQILAVPLTAYSAHVLWLVGRRRSPSRSAEEEAASALEVWAGFHRPRGEK